jgi:hypothetical protein
LEFLGETPVSDITSERKTVRYSEQGPRDTQFRAAATEDPRIAP